MPEVFTHNDTIVTVGMDWLDRLKAAALESPLRRARLCVHLASEDAVQEMILVLCKDVLFRPHRHHEKTESFHIIEGELDLVVFNDNGEPLRTIRMGPAASGKTFCYRLNSSLYHALLPRTPFVAFHETTAGPFRKGDAEFAPWAPVRPEQLRAFLEQAVERGEPEPCPASPKTERSPTQLRTFVHGYSEGRAPHRVAVLGATGFLGRALVERIADAGIEVSPVDSRDLDLSSPSAGRALAQRLRPTDAVVLLAALKPGRQLDSEGFARNLAMAATVCEAVTEARCTHVVYVSTDAVYPFTGGAVREDLAPQPESLYALMHLSRERMMRGIEGADVAILRVAQVYGAGDPHSAYGPTRMVRSALTEGRIVLYGSGEETRDHIHVGDVASVIFRVLAMRSRGVVNVAAGRSISFASLAELVSRVCGRKIVLEREPRRMPVKHRAFDTTELQIAFPTLALTPLEDGIATMLDMERRVLNRRTRTGTGR
jgi:UDP-glucose 4-epimerase